MLNHCKGIPRTLCHWELHQKCNFHWRRSISKYPQLKDCHFVRTPTCGHCGKIQVWNKNTANITVRQILKGAIRRFIHYDMEALSVLLALFSGESLGYWSIPLPKCQQSGFDIVFGVDLYKVLSEHSVCRWFETPRRPCHVTAMCQENYTSTR